MSLSTSPADQSPQPFVLASPDRVVFRTIPHPIASANKRVTLSLRRSSPSNSNNTTQTAALNTQSPNTPRHSNMNSSSSTTQPLCATTPDATAAVAKSSNTNNDKSMLPKITTIVTPPTPIRKQPVLIGKNGLPIKSALKSPVTASPTCTGQLVRPSTIRSFTSPSVLSSPKYVHFNSQLEHVRLFLQGETPSCVADRETIVDARQNGESTSDIKLTLTNWSPVPTGNFQPGDIDAGAAPLRVETMVLSQDHSELQGKILIQNIAFHKHVSVRFTIDYWQTQSEVSAEFEESIPGSSLDRFAFKIPMEMEKSKVEKTFCFAVRYQVIGREFWDSNNGMNYQVECKRVVVVAPPPASDLSKQMNSILLASRMPDYSKPVLKKKPANNRYDLSTSLFAATSQPISNSAWSKRDLTPIAQSAYRPSEYITSVQSPPGYHHSLYASSPKFVNSYLSAASPPEHFHIGFDQLSLDGSMSAKKPSRKSWGGRDQETGSAFYASSPTASAPISIPSSKAHGVGSSGYYDLVDRYCFYESSPHSGSPYSSYPNSPPAPCIRG
ncbi:hypothetical protein BGX29_009225 [Mortierella sp. GBA35]|nr:hypothetical protein BGX29_009225 [Mortierella sp. GBA35]